MPTLDASRLLRQVAEAYAACRRYEDAGSVLIGGVLSGRFETQFERAKDELLFTFSDEETKLRLAIKGERVTVFEVPDTFPERLRTPATITCAVATLAGITHLAGQIVPRLLYPAHVGGRSFTDVQAPSIVGSGLIGDDKCAWVRLGEQFADAYVAISTQSGALRRYVVAAGTMDPAWLSALGLGAASPGARLPARTIGYECRIE